MLLEVKNLSITFQRFGKALSRKEIQPVSDISVRVRRGEVVALVGSSGSGKSLIAHTLLGLLPKNSHVSGECSFNGENVTYRELQRLRGKSIALVPQSVNYLNPLAKIRRQVYRSARLSGRCCCTAASSCDGAFERYRLEERVKGYFPFQISGGMARRVLTATATAGLAELIIADEPTTGLDRETARQSLAHLKELAGENKGILLITHDLDGAMAVADTITVVYHGKTMEIFPASMLHSGYDKLHPYTRALWSALPQNDFVPVTSGDEKRDNPTGKSGCAFASCCGISCESCHQSPCELVEKGPVMTRCIHAMR